ncbi:MAG: hypothetical protein AB7U20_24780 [Planctomycetaceae bacterium]
MSQVTEQKKTAAHDAAGKKRASNTFEGKVVSVTANKLVMTNKEGKEYSHTLAKDAKLTCDGTACKAEDLKAGRRVRVTTNKDDRNVAIGIEALNKNADFGECCG